MHKKWVMSLDTARKKQKKPNKAARKRNQQRKVELELEGLQAGMGRCNELLATFTTEAQTEEMRAERKRLIRQLADDVGFDLSCVGAESVRSRSLRT